MNTNFRQCECGCDLFAIKQNVSGFSYFVVGSFGEEVDNSGMYDHLSFKKSWKYFRFTKGQIEAAGFGWVFDCKGVKVEEVEEN